MSSPFLSVIMPVYNRETLVARAIQSCLGQSFSDFEIVVVDDASTDHTVEVIQGFTDERIRLFRHEQNRGVCPARNEAMAHARGMWLVFLDSDDEILPGGFEAIHRHAANAGDDVGGLRFMCVDEHGTSPDPPHDDQLWDYERYLRWYDQSLFRRQEAMPCMRASLFPAVRYPDDRSLEAMFHLDLFRTARVKACADVVRHYHHDSQNRLTAPSFSTSVAVSADIAANAELLERRHGAAMARYAPAAYTTFLSGATTAAFLSGNRRAGLRLAGIALRHGPFTFRIYVIVVVGLLGRTPLLVLRWVNRKFRRSRQTNVSIGN
jgi:glycosyltransferase involved in cell wall biosynthesis